MDCSRLQKIEEFFERETALLEDVGESAFGQLRVHGNDCLKGFVVGTFFERNMAALLAQLHEARSFQCAHDALTGDTRQFWHVSGRLRPLSRTPGFRRDAPRAGPRSRGMRG